MGLKALCYTLKALEFPVFPGNNCLNSEENKEDFNWTYALHIDDWNISLSLSGIYVHKL